MHEVLNRIRRALNSKALRVLGGLFTIGCCALSFLPLMRVPGYELAAGLSLLTALCGSFVGIIVGRLERGSPVPRLRASLHAIAAAFLMLLAPLTLSVLLAILLTLATTPCDPFASFEFLLVLTLPTALLVAAAGTFVGLSTRRWWTAALAWLALLLVSAVHTVWPLVFGPQVFAYNHLAGYLPGPLYDEELHVPAALLWFRVGTVGLAAVFWGLSALQLEGGRRSPGVVLLPSTLLVLALEFSGTRLGFRMNDAVLAERLGAVRETAHLVLHYPRGKSPDDVERIVRDLEFRHAQVSRFLGEPQGKVTVWWYRSAQEKQALVGAAHTQFAKPWRREVHVNELPWPHPAIKHELVHAMAAPWGAPPFGVTATWGGFSPQVGIIEGLAVAGDDPIDDLTLHAWAAAMKRQRLLPDVRVLLGASGFYSAPASRAYTAAGSFLRWLGETRGDQKLRALYRHGDFAQVYGQPLSALASEWERFLDQVPLEPEAVNEAFARFNRGSLFERPCAREVARVAAEASREDDPQRALELLNRCRAVQPEEPAHVLAVADALRRLQRPDEARATVDRLLEQLADQPAPWADAALTRAGLALAQGDDGTARRLLGRIIERQVSPTLDRTARVRLAGLDLPEPARSAVTKYFEAAGEELKLFRLRDALPAVPDDPTLAYLLGRRLWQDGAPAEALPYLESALQHPLPGSLQREASRLAVETAFRAGRCDLVKARVDRSRALGATFAARLSEWVDRCEFEQLAFGGPVKP